jgi:uncharacterized protein (AIM24 family)
MTPSSTRNFLSETLETETGQAFGVVDARLVRIEVDDFVWIKRGSVVAYDGDFRFELDQIVRSREFRRASAPVFNAVKRELAPLCRAIGRGRLYVADEGHCQHVARLAHETLHVAASNVLAFERGLDHEIVTLGGVGLIAGGILAIRLSGEGAVAMSVNGDPLTLRVRPDRPICTDPAATVAWTGGLWPELKMDISARSLVAHGGGQPAQMCFRGDGCVVVHARTRAEAIRAGIVRRMTARLRGLVS